jgi:tetratricopeptide (TPR) repeat protein
MNVFQRATGASMLILTVGLVPCELAFASSGSILWAQQNHVAPQPTAAVGPTSGASPAPTQPTIQSTATPSASSVPAQATGQGVPTPAASPATAQPTAGVVPTQSVAPSGPVAAVIEALVSRAEQRYESGDVLGAIEDYTEVLRLSPGYLDAYTSRGYARAELGDPQGALADLRQALRLNPNLPEVQDALRALQETP